MRYGLWLIVGFLLYKLSGLLESFGDTAPIAIDGVSGERAMWHGIALLLMLAALACFIRVLVLAWRALRRKGGSPKDPPSTTVDVSESAAEPDFDPDAALARYLAGRGSLPQTPGAPPRQSGFGRRRS